MMTRNLRWWIAGLLFASTVINYIDRQTLAVLGPYLMRDYGWTNTDFASIPIAFRMAYTMGHAAFGWLIDRVGTRRGLSMTVFFYSAVASLTAFSNGLWGFRVFRFLLGAGESANWPGATKATSEWFPARERAWSVAMFESGSSVGGAIAPFLVVWLYRAFGTWRPAFAITGCLGFLWLLAWRALYRTPEKHPRITKQELEHIRQGRASGPEPHLPSPGWRKLLCYRQTWGIVIGRALLDPFWFFVAEWFAIILKRKGFPIETSVFSFWVPFFAADLGSFFGGALSSWWIRRGWPVGKARRTVIAVMAPTMLVLIPAAFTPNFILVISLIAWAMFAYTSCSTMMISLPADVFHTCAVASVSGLSGMGAGIGTLISTYLIGHVADKFSFEPIIVVAGIVPCAATAVFLTMVRARRQPDPAGVVLKF